MMAGGHFWLNAEGKYHTRCTLGYVLLPNGFSRAKAVFLLFPSKDLVHR